MNHCIKTGADVYLHSHSCVLHGDMYRVHCTYIFHHTGERIFQPEVPGVDFEIFDSPDFVLHLDHCNIIVADLDAVGETLWIEDESEDS